MLSKTDFCCLNQWEEPWALRKKACLQNKSSEYLPTFGFNTNQYIVLIKPFNVFFPSLVDGGICQEAEDVSDVSPHFQYVRNTVQYVTQIFSCCMLHV